MRQRRAPSPNGEGAKRAGAAGGWTDCPFRFVFGQWAPLLPRQTQSPAPARLMRAEGAHRGAAVPLLQQQRRYRRQSSNDAGEPAHLKCAGSPAFCIPYVVRAARNTPLRFALLILHRAAPIRVAQRVFCGVFIIFTLTGGE